MTHTPVFLSLHSSGLRRSAALAILPLLLASCGSSTSTASNTPAPSNTTVASSPSASSAAGSASPSAAKKTSTPCLEPDEAAKAQALKQQEAISADRGTALPSYVSARHVVRNQANFPPPRAEAESAGAECLALYEKNKADHAYAAAWVRAIDDNNVASGKVASGPRADIQSADPYKASNYVDIREGKEYFPTRQELLAANYPENYIVAFELWAQQAPADVKQKSDANRAAAKDTRWSEVVTLPSPDNPV